MSCKNICANFKTVKTVTGALVLKERNGAQLAAFLESGKGYIVLVVHASSGSTLEARKVGATRR